MDSIRLTSVDPTEFTAVSNLFIDEYMPQAHGDYVKVYLYLLRCLHAKQEDISVSSLAEHFDNTEKDILNAIGYWEQKELLKAEYDEHGLVSAISLLRPHTAKKQKEITQRPERTPKAEAQINPAVLPRPTYTAEQIAHMKEDSRVCWLLENVERYLKRLLKPADVQLILYLYESLNFPPDLILYLYEYCISMNKAHRSYIEAVALNWNRDGIRTVEQAAMTTSQYKKDYYTIAKALGFQRPLADAECSFIEKWLHTWGFPLEVILEACKRTVLQIQNPSFQYTDRILEAWHKADAHTLTQIKKQDEAFNSRNHGKQKQTQRPMEQPRRKNQFTSFEQHNYSSNDIRKMEQALLEKSAKRIHSDVE